MKEQLISLETAKLAREKGFNIHTYDFWTTGRKPHITQGVDYDGNGDALSNWNDGQGCYPTLDKDVTASAPRQSLLQKWLREEHNIHVEIRVNSSPHPYYFIYLMGITSHTLDSDTTIHYDSYEDALEGGLEKALELIK